MMEKKVVISGIEELADFTASLWFEHCAVSLGQKKYFTMALSGGTTPAPFYKKLSEIREPALWRNTHIFQADERIVAPEHPDSNLRMIRENLTGKVPLPAENLHPVAIAGNPEETASLYEAEIIQFFNLAGGAIPGFDLIILGIGADGHTASIFPGSRVIQERKRLVDAVFLDQGKHNRVTLTLPVLKNAAQIVFLATGKSKAPVLKKILQDNDTELPASLVSSGSGSTLYLLDPAAAADLPEDIVGNYDR